MRLLGEGEWRRVEEEWVGWISRRRRNRSEGRKVEGI